MVRACGSFTLAIGIGCLPLLIDLDQFGQIIWLVMVVGCLGAGLVYLWLAWQTRRSEVFTSFQFASRADEIRYFRRGLWACAVGFPLLTFVTAFELNRLESGAIERVRVWAPLALIYERFGYWPTMISLPLFGICCCAVLIGKLRKLNTPLPGLNTGSDSFSNR